jgi:hypothetical protein
MHTDTGSLSIRCGAVASPPRREALWDKGSRKKVRAIDKFAVDGGPAVRDDVCSTARCVG